MRMGMENYKLQIAIVIEKNFGKKAYLDIYICYLQFAIEILLAIAQGVAHAANGVQQTRFAIGFKL